MLRELPGSPHTPGSPPPRVLLVLSTPPPDHGTNMINRAILESGLPGRFRTTLLDISDRRSIDNLGLLDLTNVTLALRHCLELLWHGLRRRPVLVYILVSQSTLGFLRDGLFILIARLTGPARVVIHLHGGRFREFESGRPALFRAFIGFCLRKVHTGIVLADCLRDNLSPWIGNLAVVPNGTDFLRDAEPPALDTDGREPHILFMGHLLLTKGLGDLVESMPAVVEGLAGRRPVWDIAGGWSEDPGSGRSARQIRDAIEARLLELGLQDRVVFHGHVTGSVKEQLMREADLFVLPSWSEGQPVAVLEALAAGLPVVATAVGGVPGTVVDGVTGRLVAAHSPSELATAQRDLLCDDVGRARMARAARADYLERFTTERFIHTLTEVFQHVLLH